MAVDKSFNQAPLGLTAPSVGEEDDPLIEIVIEGDEGDDDAENASDAADDSKFSENLVSVLDDKVLATLASDLIAEFEGDVNSRRDWVNTYVDGLELLGMKIEERTEPWPGACGVFHPILSEALVRFQAETMMDTFPAAGPVKIELIGEETRENLEAGQRVQEDMNYQLTDKMHEYRPEHERMLWGLGLSGNAFKKVYYDPSLRRQTSVFVPAEDVVVPYGASNIQTAERITHVMRKTKNEVKKLQVAGFYDDCDLPDPTNTLDEIEKKIAESMGFRADSDNRYKLLEMHVDLVIEDDPYADEDGVALPYVVTIEKSSSKVLSIRRNWLEDDEYKQKREHFVHYSYVPGFGFYAFGLIHLIGAFAKSGTSILRQLVDAGTLSNLPGGFKTKGLRIKGDSTPISPAEFRDVDIASGTLKDNIMPLPYKEPSQVLQGLLQTIVDEGRRFASAADMKVSDMSAEAPVGTTLAILERTLKIMSAIQARIHYSMKHEFKLLKNIIRDYTPDEYSYEPASGERKVKGSDYDLVEVIPVSDPNQATLAQKVVQYQAVIQLAQMAPQIYDLPYLHRQMLNVLGIKDAEKIVPLEDDMKAVDPVSENMAALNGKPLKAFIYQDHAAHIAVHTSAMQDPKLAAIMGQNPQAQVIMAAMMAHINEHVAFQYRKEIEDAAGVPYPMPNAEMSPDMEVQISRLAAAASQKVLQANQAQAQQQQAQQQAQDPLFQLQQAELQLKAKDTEIKELKVKIDAAAKADQHQIERERIASQERIAGVNAGIKAASDKAKLSASQQSEGLRVGVDIARNLADKHHQRNEGDANRRHQAAQTAVQLAHQAKQSEADRAAQAQKPQPKGD